MHAGASWGPHWGCDPHRGVKAGLASAAADPRKGTEQPAFPGSGTEGTMQI